MVGSVGRVRKILADRGYGFIQIHGLSKDVFFHANNFKDKKIFAALQEGQFLGFKCSEVDARLRASECWVLTDEEIHDMREKGELDF